MSKEGGREKPSLFYQRWEVLEQVISFYQTGNPSEKVCMRETEQRERVIFCGHIFKIEYLPDAPTGKDCLRF